MSVLAVVVQALKVTFPTGRALLLGNTGAAPPAEVRVYRKGTSWRLDMATGSALSASLTEPKGGRRDYYGCVFVRPLTSSASLRYAEHAILDAEILLIEGHSEGTSLAARWEPTGATDNAASGSASGETAILPNVAGACWIVEGGAHLTIGVIPRNFIDAQALSGATASALQEQIGDAIKGLRKMVDDLTGAQVSIEERAALRQHAPSVATRMDTRTTLKGAVQRLHRLNHLLRDGHVLGTWDALIADPAVLLQTEYPARPMMRARQPVLHGNRGPWGLANGWSQENQVGRVLDRHVLRTVDTPPSRLAVQLANRVIVELRSIDEALTSHVEGEGQGLGTHAYIKLVRDLMHRATAVERAPIFAEVSRTAPVALDSPTLQMNRRCQPLLRAWTRLDRGLRAEQDIPVDEAVLRPLEKTNILYELWCAVRLRDLLSKALGSEPSGQDLNKILRYDWEVKGAKVLLAATMRPRQEVDENGVEPRADEERWQSEACSGVGCVQIGTKALVRLPDGLIAVQPKGAARWIVMIWDAKYRTIRDDKYLAGATYQAHAFRDALRVKIDRAAEVQPAWSVVLHPTRINAADKLIPWGDDAGNEVGVGIVTCRPTDMADSGICAFIQQICGYINK